MNTPIAERDLHMPLNEKGVPQMKRANVNQGQANGIFTDSFNV